MESIWIQFNKKNREHMEKMKRLKWSYDQQYKQWYIIESVPYANNGMDIKKDGNEYVLSFNAFLTKYRFKKLSSAKKVAQLIHNG